MKIYYVGSQSSGKTTLARYTSDKYKLPLLPESARLVLSELEIQIDSLRADIDLVNKFQTQVFYRQIAEEKKYDNFCADRSLLDSLAYSLQHSTVGSVLAADPILKQYVDRLKNSVVFFVRPSRITVKQDGVRETTSWDGIISIDAIIKSLLEMYSVRYFIINTDSMQERVRIIDSVLALAGR